MAHQRRLLITAALTLTMLAPSCSVFRKPAKKAPPPPAAPAPAARPKAQPPPKPEEVTLPSPPQISPQGPDVTQQPPVPTQTGTLPPPPKRRRGRVAKPATASEAGTTAMPPATAQTPGGAQQPGAAASPQAPAPQQPAANEAAVPQLEEILSPEQRQAFNEAIDRNLARAQRSVEVLQGRRLNREQRTNLARVRTFIQQATESRKVDLPRAKNLAERAGVLADDLLRTVQ